MMHQKEYLGIGSAKYVEKILELKSPKKIFLVSGKTSYAGSGAEKTLKPFFEKYSITHFTDFSSDPMLEYILNGLELFKDGYDLVVAIGGGSAIDVAKSINILSAQKGNPLEYIKNKKKIKHKGKPLIAIPTTAGSGSEATHFAVVYIDKVKYSLAHKHILPTYAIVDPLLTLSMPKQIAAATAMDAFSQAIESYWSVNSTKKSKSYSKRAIRLITSNILDSVNTPSLMSRETMAEAAHLAGKAINIAKTTASHALSYTLTARFGVPHGHAAALTLGQVLKYNAGVTDGDCNDPRGAAYVSKTIQELCLMLNCSTPDEAGRAVNNLIRSVGLEIDFKKLGIKDKKIDEIINSVNFERLINNPRRFTDRSTLISLFKN